MMWAAMWFLKEIFGTQFPVVVQAHNIGLTMINRFNFLKNYFIKIAIDKLIDLPHLIRYEINLNYIKSIFDHLYFDLKTLEEK